MREIDLDKIEINMGPPTEEPARQYYFMAKCREWIRAESKRLGRALTCATVTFGCQMNAKDSEKLSGILQKIGYVAADTERRILYSTIPALCGKMRIRVSTGESAILAG